MPLCTVPRPSRTRPEHAGGIEPTISCSGVKPEKSGVPSDVKRSSVTWSTACVSKARFHPLSHGQAACFNQWPVCMVILLFSSDGFDIHGMRTIGSKRDIEGHLLFLF